MPLRNEQEARHYVASVCSSASLAKLERLAAALIEANVHQNLISKNTLDLIWMRHFADSAQLLAHVSRETGIWVDFGAGAGFPGLVIAAMRPKRDVWLIESRSLRIQWLESMVGRLELTNCQVIGMDVRRVETFEAAVISARAFAPLDRLVALCARFSTNETDWILPKGRSAAQEVAMLPNKLRPMFHVEQSLTSDEAGIVIGKGRALP